MAQKVLIVEDLDTYRVVLTNHLKRKRNYEVFEASDGVEGVNLARKHRPDIILCDISMPNMNGLEVLHELSKSTETASIPFIFLTAIDDQLHMMMAKQMGASNYLTKPITADELIAAIDQLLPYKE
jgi:CheY-like chemotaxis protein